MADIKEAEITTTTTAVTLPTTDETVIVTSPRVSLPFHTCRVVIIAWAQLTTGTATSAVTPRIRRGGTTAGTLVGAATSETIKVAAGGTEPLFIIVSEERAGEEAVDYSFTLQQANATGDGSSLQATILVLIL